MDTRGQKKTERGTGRQKDRQGERERVKGVTVHRAYNISKNRNLLVSQMFSNMKSHNKSFRCTLCPSLLNPTS